MSRETIISKLEALPETSQKQVLALLNFLTDHSADVAQPAQPPGFKFSWAGGLAELGGELNAVELQHQANAWR